MRAFVVLLLVGGCIGGCSSQGMDTTVSTSGGDRVHNIGMMNDRQNYLIVSGMVAISGILFIGIGELIEQRTPKGPKCPMCNGIISGKPQLFQHCRSRLWWTDEFDPVTQEEFEEHEASDLREAEVKARVADMRSERAAQRRKNIAKAGRSTGEVSVTMIAAFGQLIVSATAGFDGMLGKAAGEGNDIIYRFFQAVVYVGIPVVIGATVVLMRR
jgi:hypothetical protein